MTSARCLNSKYDEFDIGISCDKLGIVGRMLLGSRVILWVSMQGSHSNSIKVMLGSHSNNISSACYSLRILNETRNSIQVLFHKWLADRYRVVTLYLR